jgi:serine/threonine-protein kinase HipA
MKTLFVYADFEWFKEIELIGELSFENLRGSETYGFKYSNEWLRNHADIKFSDDINNYPGMQYTKQGKDIFSCFSDALPDRWGRTLLNRKEQLSALDEKRPIKHLSSFDYLLGIDDYSRMGGFRFKIKEDGVFINSDKSLNIPPITSLRELMHLSLKLENSLEKNELPMQRWLEQLLLPGTSLGGARPKASVLDEESNLYIAKFPSRNDDYNVGLWEHLCHLLAKKAGINAASTKLVGGDKYHIFLSKRFDRGAVNKRIHFASAMTMLGLSDGDNFTSGNGYLDIVDFIVQACTDVDNNLRELYRRVCFNICVGNSDDHFRNHAFLLTPKGWTFSPAYDMNPTLSEYQSLLINSNTNEANLNILLDSCEEYMLDRKIAKVIINEVIEAVTNWKDIAVRLQISKTEIQLFSSRFNKKLDED